ncbi:MAG: hypothetical protein JSV19_03985 [Phycisphaerales bacterium]|nr:MAG: hypothetical protein JSV19_03985 [Phycisphaerales bacterium]
MFQKSLAKGGASPRLVIYGVLGIAVVVLAVYLRSRPARTVVSNFTQVPLGPVDLKLNEVQSLLLEIPKPGSREATDSNSFSLEFRGVDAGATVGGGRCRLRITDSDGVLAVWEGTPIACDWHEPWAGAQIGWDPTGTALETPSAESFYTVEFEWLELPDTSAEVHLWWEYVAESGASSGV